MMWRESDPDKINAWVNHPSIRPHIGGNPDVPLDLTRAVLDKENVFLVGEHGGFAFTWSAPSVFEVHTFVLPEGRGEWAREMSLTARDAMVDMYGARHLWTRIPPEAANVRAFAERADFKPAGQHRIDLGAGLMTYHLYEWRPECPQHS